MNKSPNWWSKWSQMSAILLHALFHNVYSNFYLWTKSSCLTKPKEHEMPRSTTMNPRLSKNLSTENSYKFKVWASVWLSSKSIWLLVQKQSLFYSTQTSTFIKGQTSYLVHEPILHLGQSSISLTLELGFSTNWDLFLMFAQHEPFITFVHECN